jgi:hypothetical protein
MFVLTHEYDEPLNSDGNWFHARAYGRPVGGTWGGWLVFFPVVAGPVVSTRRETTQPSLETLGYWASGLTEVYLQGALDRALSLEPEAELAAELEALEQLQVSADARAEALEGEAATARAESRAAEAALDRTEERLLNTIAKKAEAESDVHEKAATASRAVAHAAERALRARTPTTRSQNKKKK